jgi:hypothetical protein
MTVNKLFDLGPWEATHDGNATAFFLQSRHYSFKPYRDGRRQDLSNPNRRLFVGPGEKLVLIGDRCLFAWRKFIDASGQQGVNCSTFRNESQVLSSTLILAAEEFARKKWPLERRFYTYVNPRKIRSTNPGYCFLCAGWQRCGFTAEGKLILEKLTAPATDSSAPVCLPEHAAAPSSGSDAVPHQ